MSQRAKGARGERYFKDKLKPHFPDILRNVGEQWQKKNCSDLVNTGNWSFEVKVGKQCVIKKVLGFLQQVEAQSKDGQLKAVLCHPERMKDYVIIPYDTFEKIIDKIK